MRSAYRILDVNVNRLLEGLKTVEDIVRFQFESPPQLLRRIRRIHHQAVRAAADLPYPLLLAHRAARTDPGRPARFDRARRTNVNDLLRATFGRVKESARLLEEMSKLQDLPFASFKELRFLLYELEAEVFRSAAGKVDYRFYVILDEKYLGRVGLSSLVRMMASAGVGLVQLRMKQATTARFYRVARKLRTLTRGKPIKLVINDRLDIALAVQADGLHVGQDDLPLSKAKAIAGHLIIGQSVDNVREARLAEKAGADYIAVGSIFPTPTKDDAVVVGLETLKRISRAVKSPVVAIGGITPGNARRVFANGASGIAICSAVLEGNVASNLKKLRTVVQRAVRSR